MALRVDHQCKKKQFSLKSTDTQSNSLIAVIASKTIYEGNGELVNTRQFRNFPVILFFSMQNYKFAVLAKNLENYQGGTICKERHNK